MKDKLCIFTNVYGENYQQFIPIYIYSILKNYPEYFVYIYVDRELDNNVIQQLKILPFHNQYKIVVKNNSSIVFGDKNISDRSKLKRNTTWTIYDNLFEEYEYIYIGDIDIFICLETPSLLEQHIEHCKVLNLPYSNFIRSQYMKIDKDVKKLIRIALSRGVTEAKAWLKMEDVIIKRMTGLHFVKSKEYFEAVRPLFKKYNDTLNRVANGRGSDRENLYLKSNEILLYDILKDSTLRLPPVVPNNYSELPSDYKSIGFRPMHGIHLGVFRSDEGPIKEFQSVSSDLYVQYYKQFCEMRFKDQIFVEMEKLFQPYLKSILKRMDLFYDSIGVKNNE